MTFSPITESTIAALTDILGSSNIITDNDKMIDYSHDEYSQEDIVHAPDVVVKPDSTQQVAQIMKLAAAGNIPVTPRGSGTGLVGGCVPSQGGIVLSLERMNTVIEVDRDNHMAVVDAGTPLCTFFEKVEEAGLFFPPHPGDENATIGGIIATNAGGARAVKYGVIRNYIRGIEVVLPDGDIITIGGKMIKSSTGYSLLNLLIGSEGTLGIITRATISLAPPPQIMYTLVAPYELLADAIKTVPKIMQKNIIPLAVEFIERDPVKITEDFVNKRWPTEEGNAYLMIIIDGPDEDQIMALAEKIGEICLENNATDIFIADEKAKQRNILEIRSEIYEAMRKQMLEILDITVPRASIADFVNDVHQLESEHNTWLPIYGHAGDGNVHIHLMKERWDKGSWVAIDGWETKFPLVRDKIHELGKKYNGLISGEHGIGIIKKEYMESFLGSRQLALMKAIKDAFDPRGILNPGKII